MSFIFMAKYLLDVAQFLLILSQFLYNNLSIIDVNLTRFCKIYGDKRETQNPKRTSEVRADSSITAPCNKSTKVKLIGALKLTRTHTRIIWLQLLKFCIFAAEKADRT